MPNKTICNSIDQENLDKPKISTAWSKNLPLWIQLTVHTMCLINNTICNLIDQELSIANKTDSAPCMPDNSICHPIKKEYLNELKIFKCLVPELLIANK